jgi:hypothetical protein
MMAGQEKRQVRQGRVEENQEWMVPKSDTSVNVIQEGMEAAIISIRSEFQDTMYNRAEGVLVSVEQRTQSLRVELGSDQVGATKDLRTEFDAEIQRTRLDIQTTKTLVEATQQKSKLQHCVAAAER